MLDFFDPPQATAVDPYFNQTTLLLKAPGANAADNKTFLDGSSNAFTVARNGGAPGMSQGTFSPYSAKGWSAFLDGTAAYIIGADQAGLRFGSSNFTIQAWVFRTVAGATHTICSKGAATPTGWVFQINSSNQLVFTDTSTSITSTATIPAAVWTYVAVVRAGTGASQTTLYINGTADTAGTSATTFSQTDTLKIGVDRSAANFFSGYISNLQLSSTNRTISGVPTSAFVSDANSIFLGANANRFKDDSSLGVVVTVSGAPKIQPLSPFAPSAAYSTATHGGSGYFDGTGDWLSTTGVNTALGSGDFTIEGWIYCTGYNGGAAVYSSLNTYPASTGLLFYIFATTGKYTVDINGSNLINTGAVPLNAWTHVAVVRSGSTVTVYGNGVSIGSGTSSANFSNQYCAIGRTGYGAASNYFLGHMSELRVVVGTAVYTGAFTPPTAPLTAITNTQLLLHFANSGITDATAGNDIESVGSAQASTSVVKYGPQSMKIASGTSDYLTISNAGQTAVFGAGDFTIEKWVYTSSATTSQYIYDSRPAATNGLYPTIYIDASNHVIFYTNTGVQITGTTALGASWNHIAVCRASGVTRLFVNGVQEGSSYTDTNVYLNGASRPVIGSNGNTVGTYWNGYIEDLRVTKGVARYTAAFTPPTQPLPAQ